MNVIVTFLKNNKNSQKIKTNQLSVESLFSVPGLIRCVSYVNSAIWWFKAANVYVMAHIASDLTHVRLQSRKHPREFGSEASCRHRELVLL